MFLEPQAAPLRESSQICSLHHNKAPGQDSLYATTPTLPRRAPRFTEHLRSAHTPPLALVVSRPRSSSCQRPALRFSSRFRPARLRAARKRGILAPIRLPTYVPLRALCELLALGASLQHLGRALLASSARGRQRVAAGGCTAGDFDSFFGVCAHLRSAAPHRRRSASASASVMSLASLPLPAAVAARLPSLCAQAGSWPRSPFRCERPSSAPATAAWRSARGWSASETSLPRRRRVGGSAWPPCGGAV